MKKLQATAALALLLFLLLAPPALRVSMAGSGMVTAASSHLPRVVEILGRYIGVL